MAEVGALEAVAVNDVDGPSNSKKGIVEGWVKKITCPLCGATTGPTGKAFAFGVFDGRGYLCEGCGKPFNAFYRDRVFSHTVPKGDVELIDIEEKEIEGPPPEDLEIGEEGALPAPASPPWEEEPRVRAEEGWPETKVPSPPPSVAGILESMRRLKEDFAYINEISAEEGAIVEAFFVDFLRVMTALRGALEVDVSILPPELGDPERASVTPRGGLVVLRRDGNMESIDLTAPRNRDLFVTVIDDVLPKIVVLSAEIRVKIENRLKYLSRVTEELQKMASSLPERKGSS